MVELVKTFSFDENILPQILDKRRRREDDFQRENFDLNSWKEHLNAHIVGQERDNAILFSWFDNAPDRKVKHLVTYIGQYEPSSQEVSLLFIHDKEAEIVSASVNQERTLLAFTVLDECTCPSEEKVLDPDHGGIYKSFLAEICPYNRVFSLDVEKHFFQRVQFLYSSFMSYGEVSRKESHMLFFHHTESVSLYQISMNKVGDNGMIMSSQPHKEPLHHKFTWLQWDSLHQRLYYVYNKPQSKSSAGEVVLGAYQFSDKPMCYTKVMEIPLPSCIKLDLSKRPSYKNWPLCNVISDQSVNMYVVTLQGVCSGSFFLCYQRPYKPEPVLSDSDDESGEKITPSHVDLQYYVLAVHHDHIVHCTLPLELAPEQAAKIRIHFNTFNEYLVVFVPGITMHLLDMSIEHGPCHHIVFQDTHIPRLQESSMTPPTLTHINKLSPKTNGTNLFDCTNNSGYKLVFNRKSIVEIFARTHLPSTRLALLHLILVHLKDVLVMRKMFEHLCCDPSSPECTDLLKEFLVCSAYGQMKRVVDRNVLKFLPLTCVDMFRGHLEKSPTGKRLARILFSPWRVSQECFLVAKGLNRKDFDFWIYLRCRGNYVEQRFVLKPAVENEDDQDTIAEQKPSKGVISSMIKHLSGSGRRKSNDENTKENNAAFLESAGKVSKKEENRQSKLAKQLSTHLALHMPKEARMKLETIAKEYINIQSQQSVQLLQLFWNALGFSSANHPLHMHLVMQGSPRDCALFQLLERYFTAATDKQFPLPPGFHTFFTTVGFRCLSTNLFLQYVDNGVLKLKRDFLNKVLEDLGKTEEYSGTVFQILSRQKHQTLGRLLQQWDHPVSARCLSQRFVARLLTDDEDTSDAVVFPLPSTAFYGPSYMRDLDSEEHAFQPLVMIMEQLKKKAGASMVENRDGRSRSYSLDLMFVEQSSLKETQENIGENLKSVSF